MMPASTTQIHSTSMGRYFSVQESIVIVEPRRALDVSLDRVIGTTEMSECLVGEWVAREAFSPDIDDESGLTNTSIFWYTFVETE